MSVIKIIVNPSDLTIDVVKSFHKIIGGSIGELKYSLENGTPIFEKEIFTNTYEEHTFILRKILKEIEKLKFNHSIFEGEDEISIEILLNILDFSDEIGKEQKIEYNK